MSGSKQSRGIFLSFFENSTPSFQKEQQRQRNLSERKKEEAFSFEKRPSFIKGKKTREKNILQPSGANEHETEFQPVQKEIDIIIGRRCSSLKCLFKTKCTHCQADRPTDVIKPNDQIISRLGLGINALFRVIRSFSSLSRAAQRETLLNLLSIMGSAAVAGANSRHDQSLLIPPRRSKS